MFYMFLSSYRKTRESLEELKKAVETLACSLLTAFLVQVQKLWILPFKYNGSYGNQSSDCPIYVRQDGSYSTQAF